MSPTEDGPMYLLCMNAEDAAWPDTWIVTFKEYMGVSMFTVRFGAGVRSVQMFWHVANVESDGSVTYI